jgi:hypothetical protein
MSFDELDKSPRRMCRECRIVDVLRAFFDFNVGMQRLV